MSKVSNNLNNFLDIFQNFLSDNELYTFYSVDGMVGI